MRLIVDHRDFPFGRETRLARVADLILLLLLAALIGTAAWRLTHRAPPAATVPGHVDRQLVLTIHADGRWILNGRLVPPDGLEAELARAFATRGVRLLFVTAHPDRPYGEVLQVMDRARAAGAEVGLLPPPDPSSRSR